MLGFFWGSADLNEVDPCLMSKHCHLEHDGSWMTLMHRLRIVMSVIMTRGLQNQEYFSIHWISKTCLHFWHAVGYCRQIHLTRDFFSTLSSLCTHHIVAQGVARRVCINTCSCTCHHVSERLLFPFVFFLCLSCFYFLSHFYLFSGLNFNLHVVENAEH